MGITVAVATASSIGAFFYSQHHTARLLETARETARAQGEIIRVALEHQMMENDRSLLARMLESFGTEPHVASVMLLDRQGIVRVASVPDEVSRTFSIESPTCQACHRFPPAERMSSQVIDTAGSSMLRTVIPIRNQPMCHTCHDPSHGINGILILDLDTSVIRADADDDLGWLVLGTGSLALLLIAGIAVVVRQVVLRRLQRFETTAREIAGGNLERRVPEEGSDTIAWLAREFNTMADSMAGLLTQVHGQQKRLETVINSIDDGIVVLDAERHVTAANDAFLRRTGHLRSEVLGTGCGHLGASVCTTEDCPTLACLGSGERQVRICQRETTDGSTRWEEVYASPVVAASGKLTHVVEVWRDISDRRAAEARMGETHRLASLGMLASGYSHELNTPLATTLTCVEGILRDGNAGGPAPLDAERIREHATVARDQLLRCRGITQHFLRLSRGQASATDVVDLHAAISAVARLVEPTARTHSVSVTVAQGSGPTHVRADEAELQHVLINLVLNAVQASPPGAEVQLSFEGHDPVRIRVHDHGCGIAAEDQKRIFEPFFGLRQNGTGLGLFLSLNFVRHWGGDISLTSAVDEGSTFEVTLPAVDDVASAGLP